MKSQEYSVIFSDTQMLEAGYRGGKIPSTGNQS